MTMADVIWSGVYRVGYRDGMGAAEHSRHGMDAAKVVATAFTEASYWWDANQQTGATVEQVMRVFQSYAQGFVDGVTRGKEMQGAVLGTHRNY